VTARTRIAAEGLTVERGWVEDRRVAALTMSGAIETTFLADEDTAEILIERIRACFDPDDPADAASMPVSEVA
jgi:hypothetical protein